MAVDTESKLTITTEKTDVASLSAGDLIHVAYPLPHPQVVSNEQRAFRVVRNRRSVVTLVDSEGVEKRFRLSPARSVNRVTNPAIPIGPWNTPESSGLRVDVSEDIKSWQREDALWHKLLAPLGRPFVRVWRELLDLQCRAHSVRLGAGFWSVVVLVAVGLSTRFSPVLSAIASVIGGRLFDWCWIRWQQSTRRKIATAISMRVRYKPFGPDAMQYGTLRVSKAEAVIINAEQTSAKPWSSTELQLHKNKKQLARCVFANDIRGDLRYTCSKIAEAIRHRIDNGSRRAIYATSSNYDPDQDEHPDIVLFPQDNQFEIYISDKESRRRFSVRLKLHQARVLADALEVMDDMRRL